MKSLVIGGSNTSAFQIPDAAIRYLNPAGGLANLSVEGSAELPCREAGTFSNMQMYLPSNTASVTTVVTLRKSGAGTAVTFSVGPDLAGLFEDNVNTASFANTDTFCIEVNVPTEAGSNFFNIHTVALTFTPDNSSNTISWLCAEGNPTITINGASQTGFYNISGFISNSSESGQKFRIRRAYTASNFHLYISSNARVNDTVFRTRKNGANGNQIITVGAGLAGYFEDNSNSDSLAIGDDYNFTYTTGTGTENLVLVNIGVQLLSTEGYFQMMWANGATTTQATNLTRFMGVNNGRGGLNATETNVQVLPRFDLALTDLAALLANNTFTNLNSTCVVRDNGGDGNNLLTFVPGGALLQVDTTHSDTITGGTDEICFKVTTPNQAGNLLLRWISVIGKESSAPPPSDTPLRMLMGVGQ